MGLFARRNILTLLLLTCLFNAIEVEAYSPGRPQPYAIESGNYVYVNFTNVAAENKVKYIESKEKRVKERCKNREQQLDYLKDWCDTLDAIRRYPHSGVFRKNEPSRPVWWGGSCDGASYMTTDGNYIVQMGGRANSIDHWAFRICRRDKVIAQYLIKDLVDDESRLSRDWSLHWIDEIRFKKQSSTLFIKTLDNNEYTFDVRTGKIIEYNYKPPELYEALVFLKNRKHEIFRDIALCGGVTSLRVFMGNDFPAHQFQIADPVIKEKGGKLVQTGAISFEHIREARFISGAGQRDTWEIITPQRQSGQVMIDSTGVDFCGKGNDGKEIKIAMTEIASLKMSPTKSLPAREGIRTVEQRMSWDIKQWDETRRQVCENTQVEQYRTLSDLRKMLRQYASAKCTDISEKYITAMEKINLWLQQQRLSSDLLNASQDVARFQLQNGLPHQALDLYEYLSKSYLQLYGENFPRLPYQRTYYLQQMMSASHQAGLLDKYKKYRKLYDIAYAERQKLDAEAKEKTGKALSGN